MLIQHYYQTILREDLLLKYNYSHVMRLPQLSKLFLKIQPAKTALATDPQSKLALEIVSGQAVSKSNTLSSRGKNASNLLAKLPGYFSDDRKVFRLKLEHLEAIDCSVIIGHEVASSKSDGHEVPNLKTYAGNNSSPTSKKSDNSNNTKISPSTSPLSFVITALIKASVGL